MSKIRGALSSSFGSSVRRVPSAMISSMITAGVPSGAASCAGAGSGCGAPPRLGRSPFGGMFNFIPSSRIMRICAGRSQSVWRSTSKKKRSMANMGGTSVRPLWRSSILRPSTRTCAPRPLFSSTRKGDSIGIDTFRLPSFASLSKRFSRYRTVCSLMNGSKRRDSTIPATVRPMNARVATPATQYQNLRFRITAPAPSPSSIPRRDYRPRSDR